jgi:hypothetical protein
MNNMFCDLTPCSLVEVHPETHVLLTSSLWTPFKSYNKPGFTHACLFVLLFDSKDGDSRLLRNVSEILTGLHGVTSRKMVLVIVTAVRTQPQLSYLY